MNERDSEARGDRPTIEIVVAISENGVIGRDGDLPWRLPDDLKHFKRLTVGHAVLMGRRTYESIGRPLPERRNLVLSGRQELALPGVTVVHSFEEALAAARAERRLFVVGGSRVFAEALPRADVVHLTLVHAQVAGETRWPGAIPEAGLTWREQKKTFHGVDDRHTYAYTMTELIRRK